MSATLVRPTVEADIPALAEIAAASYRSAFATILAPAVLATRNPLHFRARFGETWTRMATAERDGAIVGFTLVTDGHIDMLFIDPARQGQGAGTALLRAAERDGAKTLECFADNETARAFYLRSGWRHTRSYERAFGGKLMRFVLFERPSGPA